MDALKKFNDATRELLAAVPQLFGAAAQAPMTTINERLQSAFEHARAPAGVPQAAGRMLVGPPPAVIAHASQTENCAGKTN